jgi:hypothetical protein
MKIRKLALLAAALLLALASAHAWADQAGDDLVLCCQPNLVRSFATAAGGGTFNPQYTDCTALDGSVKSMNSCKGILAGCAENAFACEPAADGSPGLKDCFCSQRGALVPYAPAAY